jgi:selenide,water dikinase
MKEFEAHSCTDITGFGFIGHALEMAKASQVGMKINSKNIPVLPGAIEYASQGLIPGGAYTNRDFFSCKVSIKTEVSQVIIDLLYDPQTSGGLLISLTPEHAEKLVKILKEDNIDSWIVGEVTENAGLIEII